MRSFGLYYKKEETIGCQLEFCPIVKQKVKSLINPDEKHLTQGNNIVEVHCNLWKIPEKTDLTESMKNNEKYNYFLDFGLMFDPSIKELVVHLPFEFDEQNFSDLGEKLNDQELSSLIFNDNAETTSSARNFHLIKFSDKSLLVYPISTQNLKFKPTKEIANNSKEYIGTNIFISIKSNPQEILNDLTGGEQLHNVKIYIRFRLNLSDNELKNICKKEFISTDIIQSIFSKNEMFDFRINDDREINRKLDEELQSMSYRPFRMNKVHFLFMADIRNPVVKASENYKTRFLETEKWGEYVGMPIPESMLAYHWKDKKDKTLELKSELLLPADSREGFFQLIFNQIPFTRIKYLAYDKTSSFSTFKLFFMLTYPHRNWKQVFFYAFIAIFLGCVGSILSSLILKPTSFWIAGGLGVAFLLLSYLIIWYSWKSLKKDSRVKFHE